VSIRDHRYLLGFALGLSLPDDYGGERHPDALRASALGNYAAELGGKHEVSPGVPASRNAIYGLGALLFACAFGLWLQRTAARAQIRARWGLAVLSALALCALGLVFPRIRPFIHEPTYLTLSVLWLGLWIAAALVSWRTRSLELAALILALPLFAAVPTVYRYGAAAAMAPAWLGWIACFGAREAALRRPRPPLTEAAPLLALLLPFGFSEATDFRFDEWVLWPPAKLPSGFLLLSLLAKLVVFVPPRATARARVLGVLAALAVAATQLGVVPSAAQLLAALVLFLVAAQLRRTGDRDSAIALFVGALLVLHHYAIRVPASAYYWQDCLLAALVLSARLVRGLPAPARTHAHAVLLFFAFFASGWVSFAWTLHRLEWRFLYDYWSEAFVESHVVAFLPLLLGRFALPLLAARALLARELQESADPAGKRALGLAWLLAGSKVASLMFWSYGIAFVSVASDVYLESVQEACLASALLVGLL
jgi:hypothetical protein